VDEPPVLELRGITKRFPGVLANDHVDLDVAAGEVHALLGENGAGKSTLMNILYGLYHPDSGEILLNGKKTSFASAKDAIESGIGMVHQHFMLIPVMTVAENIVLAEEPTYAGVMLDFGEARKRVRELSDRYGLAAARTSSNSDPAGSRRSSRFCCSLRTTPYSPVRSSIRSGATTRRRTASTSSRSTSPDCGVCWNRTERPARPRSCSH